MAYGIYLVTLNEEQITQLIKTGNKSPIIPSNDNKIIMTTHYYVTYGTAIKEFDNILTEAIEGQIELNNLFWHPLRTPRYTSPDNVKSIANELIRVWNNVMPSIPSNELEFYLNDFEPIFDFYKYATANNKWILSFLTKPFDKERAEKVKYPLDIIEKD